MTAQHSPTFPRRRTLAALALASLIGLGTLAPAQAAPQEPQGTPGASAPGDAAGGTAAEYRQARDEVPQVGPQTEQRARAWSEAAASQAEGTDSAFYDVPADLPSEPGALIRSEPSTFYQDPVKRIEAPAHATRIMYTSRDRTGRSIGVTGTALASTKPWPGPASAP